MQTVVLIVVGTGEQVPTVGRSKVKPVSEQGFSGLDESPSGGGEVVTFQPAIWGIFNRR